MVAKRLGVGATPSAAAAAAGASENVSEDWTKSIKKQILNVGRKRRHDNIYGADDDDDDDNNNAADDNSSSDEEEGRTTAVKERKKKKTVPVSTDVSSLVVQGGGDATSSNDGGGDTTKSKKKKKKGKKERAQERQATQNATAESTKEGEGVAASSSSTPSSDKEQTTEVVVATNTTTTETKKKRKRPKVRSRQKNIAKDNRAANDKPSHLVLGRDDYAGRPMTQRTREKLGLGKSKSSMNKSRKSVKLDHAFQKGEWVDHDGLKEGGGGKPASSSAPDGIDDSKPAADNADLGESVKSSKEEGSLKKIGDCIVDYEPSSSTPDKKKKKKDKKMKKKKYKNV